MRARRVVACVVAIAGLACRERSTTTVKRDDVTTPSASQHPAKNGGIVGRVRFAGPVPYVAGLRGLPSACASTEILDLVVGDDGGLADAFVRIAPSSVPASPRVADSASRIIAKDCTWRPHATLVSTGNTFVLQNDDVILHDATGYDAHRLVVYNRQDTISDLTIGQFLVEDAKETIFDVTLPPKTDAMPSPPTTDVVRIVSKKHPWMNAVVYVGDPQWSRITDKTGLFTIDDVPPGEHDVESFHADVMLQEHWQTQHVVIPDYGGYVHVEFVYTYL